MDLRPELLNSQLFTSVPVICCGLMSGAAQDVTISRSTGSPDALTHHHFTWWTWKTAIYGYWLGQLCLQELKNCDSNFTFESWRGVFYKEKFCFINFKLNMGRATFEHFSLYFQGEELVQAGSLFEHPGEHTDFICLRSFNQLQLLFFLMFTLLHIRAERTFSNGHI